MINRRVLLRALPAAAALGDGGAPAAAAAVTEISLERTPCFGTCPVDRVILRADGSATYTGVAHVPLLGEQSGTFSPDDFARLAQLLLAERFFSLRDRYSRPVSDLPSVITSARRGAQWKSVVDYGGAGPLRLWTVEQAIRGVASGIEWEP